MTATIKICGLRDYNAIKMSVDSGAKYLGFVCDYPRSPRNISPYKLVELMEEISHFDAYKVAVTVNPDDTVIDIIKGSIDFLQLHGSETNQRILEIKKRSNLKIIKAIKIGAEKDLQQLDSYRDADDLLLDTPAMEHSELLMFPDNVRNVLELVCHESKKALLVTKRKMRVGPSESACRSRLQTTLSCLVKSHGGER
jgi:phosphoribosylanthranilate isomerase